MAASSVKTVRCAIYTRKSTEHGLELEFNSLDAQRDACEAYIKSQASQGWRALPHHYDDPAYSGGNLDRPALQQLLKDIDAGRIDVIVVYKIDRLTRSLADFAKLVEAFDAKSISFVAVTQQFNTTTSMGRLTLNVLLSFAQFERELSSERVRDKIAASRRKGKWTGGSVPLGYNARDKKLIVNKPEAETVQYIFKRYLDLKSFAKLVEDLDNKGIITKRRNTKVKKFNGGIPFTYGPLAHLLKNRLYVGETGHKNKWFPGEHPAIVDKTAFEKVQELLASNSADRTATRSASEALLLGKIYDDRGNRMSPSYSVKNGIRYRFYVSSALLRGRAAEAGSLGRISATEIEVAVRTAVSTQPGRRSDQIHGESDAIGMVERVVVAQDQLSISLTQFGDRADNDGTTQIRVPWSVKTKTPTGTMETDGENVGADNAILVRAIIRAHAWKQSLLTGTHGSVEKLAEAEGLHPKVVRQALRLAFLSPGVTAAVLEGKRPAGLSLAQIPKLLPLSWLQHQRLLG
jgi:site-specific DNA recombinase